MKRETSHHRHEETRPHYHYRLKILRFS
uniref:Uncharacterized protein n=1 Tax=Anguilla anguilla TaxID=7936 RepID=A0A0E9RD95_ANGAN